jgi:glycine/D-amino acid oxidase-like deaminating enzyme
LSKYDILIIGAGILGMASAYHLLSNNPSKKILVIDNLDSFGQASTARSAAMFRNTFSSTDNQILSNTSIDFYLNTQEKRDLGLKLIGYLWLMNEEQLKLQEVNIEKMEKNGIELRTFSREELKNSMPELSTTSFGNSDAQVMDLPNVEAAVLGLKCGKLEPDRLAKFYYDSFIVLGGKCQFNTRATRLIVEPRRKLGLEDEPFIWQDAKIGSVEVQGANNGSIYAQTIVLAGGAWSNILLEPIGLDGHIKSKKRQIFQLDAKERQLRELLHAKGFNKYGVMPFTILPKCSVYLKPVEPGSQFWVGCDADTNIEFLNLPDYDLSKYSPEPDYYRKQIYPILHSYFTCFENVSPSGMWAGLIAYNTLDFLPYVFEHENLIIVGGDSASGIMKADALGRIVDALYRQNSEAMLYGDIPYNVAKLGIKKRSIEREEWLL